MAKDIRLKNVDGALYEHIKESARQNGRSICEELMYVLTRHYRNYESREALLERIRNRRATSELELTDDLLAEARRHRI